MVFPLVHELEWGQDELLLGFHGALGNWLASRKGLLGLSH